MTVLEHEDACFAFDSKKGNVDYGPVEELAVPVQRQNVDDEDSAASGSILARNEDENSFVAQPSLSCDDEENCFVVLPSLFRSFNAAKLEFDLPRACQLYSQIKNIVEALPYMSAACFFWTGKMVSCDLQQWVEAVMRLLAMAEHIDMRFDELVSDCSLASAAWVHLEIMDRGGDPGSCVEVAATCHLEYGWKTDRGCDLGSCVEVAATCHLKDRRYKDASQRISSLTPSALDVESWLLAATVDLHLGATRRLRACQRIGVLSPGCEYKINQSLAEGLDKG
jgi:hypothetical protein